MDITAPTFTEAMKELEAMATDFAVPADTPGYEKVWTPDNTIRMWSVPRQTGEYLYNYVLTHKPKVILELGTSSGYSAIWMAAAAQSYGGHVYTVEVAEPKITLAQSYIDRVGLQDSITIIPGMVGDVLATWEKPIDLLFLDADKMNYLGYIQAIEPMFAEGATLIADNVLDFAHLMQDFLSYIETSDRYQSEVVAIDHGLLVAAVG